MCLGIPMRVIEPMGREALCEGRKGRQLVDTALVGAQPEGAWLLTFLGSAREVLTAEAAGQIDRALDALAGALAGDAAAIEAGFADLVGREPTLPAHLVPRKD